MPGYKDDATALIAEPQFGGLAMCLIDDRILQIRAGIVTPGNDVGVNWREQALDTLVSSRLHNPPLQVSHWMRLAMGKFVADYNGLKPMRDTESGEQHFSLQTRSVRDCDHRDIRLIYAQVLEIGNLQKPAVADPGSGKVSLGLARRGGVAA